ncbi:MAG: acyl carrier protein [Burkholderiaceae bacterium]
MMNTQLDTIDQFLGKFDAAVDFQEPVPLAADTALQDLPEWDSLAALCVIVMFDMEYGKTITGEHIQKCRTLTDLYQLAAA